MLLSLQIMLFIMTLMTYHTSMQALHAYHESLLWKNILVLLSVWDVLGQYSFFEDCVLWKCYLSLLPHFSTPVISLVLVPLPLLKPVIFSLFLNWVCIVEQEQPYKEEKPLRELRYQGFSPGGPQCVSLRERCLLETVLTNEVSAVTTLGHRNGSLKTVGLYDWPIFAHRSQYIKN